MKKDSRASAQRDYDMLPEYRFDYSQSRPNRFAPMFARGKIAVILEPDVAAVFNTSESVNRLLRSVIAALPEKPPLPIARRKKAGQRSEE